MRSPRTHISLVAIAALMSAPGVVVAQGRGGGGGRAGPPVVMDTARMRQLYVSNRLEDHPRANYDTAMVIKRVTDSIYAARSAGVMQFRKITYKSSVDGMDIPAYVFEPLELRGDRAHAAMIWVHGGVHGNWGTNMFPFLREAVQRGYVIITPEYRGSTGFGEAHHNAIDYGGKELDDVMSAVGVLRAMPHVNPDRLGIMGWSHGGFITAHLLFRKDHPFKAGAAIVPVTNLFFRLAYSGPGYQRSFATHIGGLPHEMRDEYIKRSPIFHVDNLEVPILVHVATNDDDVRFVEDQQMIDALRARKPHLAETKIYVDPAPGPASRGP